MSSRIVGSDPVTVKRSADELLAGNYSFRGEYSFSQKSSSGRSKSSRRANKSSSNSHLNKTGPVVLPKVDTGNRGRDRSRRPAKSSSRSRSVPRTAAWGAKEARKREGQLQKVNGDPKTRPLSYIRAYEDVDDSEVRASWWALMVAAALSPFSSWLCVLSVKVVCVLDIARCHSVFPLSLPH